MAALKCSQNFAIRLQSSRKTISSRATSMSFPVWALSEAGIPVGVLHAPIIPGLTDHEIPSLVAAAVEAGAKYASYVVLRLPYAVAPLFEQWLTQHFPQKKDK